MKLSFRTWQISTSLLITAWAPLVGDLIVTITIYALGGMHHRLVHPISIVGVVIAFWVSVPLAYMFGIIPSFLEAAFYCVILTALPRLRQNVLGRAILGVLCGGVIGGLWCYVLHWDLKLYAAAAAVTSGLLASRWPRNDHKIVKEPTF